MCAANEADKPTSDKAEILPFEPKRDHAYYGRMAENPNLSEEDLRFLLMLAAHDLKRLTVGALCLLCAGLCCGDYLCLV